MYRKVSNPQPLTSERSEPLLTRPLTTSRQAFGTDNATRYKPLEQTIQPGSLYLWPKAFGTTKLRNILLSWKPVRSIELRWNAHILYIVTKKSGFLSTRLNMSIFVIQNKTWVYSRIKHHIHCLCWCIRNLKHKSSMGLDLKVHGFFQM